MPGGAIAGFDEILRWLKEDPTLRDWLNEDGESDILSTVTSKDLVEMAALTSYQGIKGDQGFDVKHSLKLIFSTYKKYIGRVQEEVIDFQVEQFGKTVKFQFKKKDTIARDIKTIVFQFFDKGTNWHNIIKKSIPEFATVLEWWKEKYNINLNARKPGESLPPDMVTVPRIVACFPSVACEYYHKNRGKCLFSLSQLGFDEKSQMSHALHCFFFSAVIPSQAVLYDDNTHLLFFLSHILADNVIHSKALDYTPLNGMLSYYIASYRSVAVPQAARKKFCVFIGTWDAKTDSFAVEIREAAKTAEAKIRSLRSQDIMLDSVIGQLRSLKN